MVINFEFLDDEPIENVITCMHFKVDKVVLFGYQKVIDKRKKATTNFLEKYCHVSKVVFFPLSMSDLKSVLKNMGEEIEREKGDGNEVYFDLTGGESMILVAFGMLCEKYNTPMHIYDIPNDKLIELNKEDKNCLSKRAIEQNINLDIDSYIEMCGGIINYGLQNGLKEDGDTEFADDVAGIWRVAKRHIDSWNLFSGFLRKNMIPDENLLVKESGINVCDALHKFGTALNTVNKLDDIVDDLADEGLLLNVQHRDGIFRFKFKNLKVKECIWDGGSIFELNTYQEQRKVSDDCKIGVHLDWDGVIHASAGTDVLNEIDVLSLTGNVLTFISCKSGKMEAQNTLHALYELETVTRRFGGKYARKILVSAQEIDGAYLERASEMGIEVQ